MIRTVIESQRQMIYNHTHDDSTQRKIPPMKAKHVKIESAEEDDPIYKEPPMAITLGWWHQLIREVDQREMNNQSPQKRGEEQHQRVVKSEKKKSEAKRRVAKRKQRKK